MLIFGEKKTDTQKQIEKAAKEGFVKLDIHGIESIIMVYGVFKDPVKTFKWFHTKNPNFGEISPMELLLMGRSQKLKKLIKGMIDGETP